MNIIEIFIDSSNELKNERDQIELFLYWKNYQLEQKQIKYEIVRWEYEYHGYGIQQSFTNIMLFAFSLFYLLVKKIIIVVIIQFGLEITGI